MRNPDGMKTYIYDKKIGCPETPPELGSRSRIVIVGTSGSGKTTLAALLATRLGIRDIELDGLFWEPGWKECEPEEFRARIGAAIASCGEGGYAIHGNYNRVRDLTWGRCDTVIWLDYSRFTVMSRVFRRTLSRVFGRRQLWKGNRETFRKAFLSKDSIILWAWNTHESRKAQYTRAMRENEHGIAQFVVLRDPLFVQGFLTSLRAPENRRPPSSPDQ